jgi:hypothetical protein
LEAEKQRGERFNVVTTEAGKQKVTRSWLADKELWRLRSERFNVVAMEAGEQEVTRWKLVDGEILGQRS